MSKVMKNPPRTKEILSFSLQEIFSGSEDQAPPKLPDTSLTENVSQSNTPEKERPDKQTSGPEENLSEDSEIKIRLRLDELEKKAYEKGFSEGKEAGQKSGIEEGAPNRQKLANLIEEIKYLRESTLKIAENNILDIALSVAQRVIREKAKKNREGILHVIQEGIHKIGESEEMRVRLHPGDLEMMAQEADELSDLLQEKGRLQFEADQGLSPGDCIIEGPKRIVDGRLSSQFTLLEKAIRETVEKNNT